MKTIYKDKIPDFKFGQKTQTRRRERQAKSISISSGISIADSSSNIKRQKAKDERNSESRIESMIESWRHKRNSAKSDLNKNNDNYNVNVNNKRTKG